MNEETNTQQEQKTYTQEEVDKLIQSETDKRVTQALKKQQRKFDEASKLANMSEQEKADYQFSQREKDLEEREAALMRKELTAEATRQLADQGLPASAVEFIVGVDAEATAKNIKAFKKMFDEAISKEVAARVSTGAPKADAGKLGMSKDEFKKMTLAQQSELFRTNPELYNALRNQ